MVFLDGITLSNLVPSPAVILATYLGFINSGIYGAVIITLGIYLPAFLFTLYGFKYVEKIIENKSIHSFLDCFAAGVVSLFLVTAVKIFFGFLNSISAFIIFFVVMALLYLKEKISIPLIIACSAIAGYLISYF